MAQLRLILPAGTGLTNRVAPLLVLGTLACGCGSSEADPGSGLTPPPGFQALPALAAAATSAARGDQIAVAGSEAWGDPARGCYAAWLVLRGVTGDPTAIAERLVSALNKEPALAGIKLDPATVTTPTRGDASLGLTVGFSAPAVATGRATPRSAYDGRLRAAITDDGTIRVIACFWNQREPAACAAACTPLVESLK